MDGNLWIVYLAMFVVSLGFILYVLSVRNLKANMETHQVPIVVSIFSIVFTIYHLVGSSWVLWRWYAYPIVIMSIFVIPVVVDQIIQHIRQFDTFRYPIQIGSQVGVVILLILSPLVIIRWRNARLTHTSFKYDNYVFANVMNAFFPDPGIFAVGDKAASFAYFFKGNVLNLEGLVGDYELVEAIQSNSLTGFMNAKNVQYVLSNLSPPDNYIQWELITPHPELSSGPYTVILLCTDSEFIRKKTLSSMYYVWEWPSCK